MKDRKKDRQNEGREERKTERKSERKEERNTERQTRPFQAIPPCSLDSLKLHPLAAHKDRQHCLSWDKEQ